MVTSQMITANYFDGQNARLHPVELQPGASALNLLGGSVSRQYALSEVTLAEAFAHAPLVLYFADGARCEVPNPQAGRALADALGYRKSLVVRWQEHWYAALLALVLLIAAGFAVVIWGLPAAAEKIAASIPASLDKRLGETATRALEKQMMAPSRLSEQRIAEVEQILRRVAPATTRQPIRLLVRSSPRLGANALALPDGTIMITDAMVLQILGKADRFGEFETAQLAGVLAHEIGHIQLRHSVRVMARSSLTAAASAAMFGDFSLVAAGLPAVVMNMSYSRGMEYDADGYAIALLKEKDISPAPLADLFDALEKIHADDPASSMPRWMTVTIGYVASHPASEVRSERLRQAAQR
jgi:Zn-dependent protease with chaperone function